MCASIGADVSFTFPHKSALQVKDFKPMMKENIVKLLRSSEDRVNVKARTHEKVRDGISCAPYSLYVLDSKCSNNFCVCVCVFVLNDPCARRNIRWTALGRVGHMRVT
jgi:hypothetical protein